MATVTSLGFNIFSKYDGRGVSRAKRDLRDLGRMRPTVTVNVETSKATAAIDRLKKNVNELSRKSGHIKFSADTKSATVAIDRLQHNVNELSRKTGHIRFTADTKQALVEIKRLQTAAHDKRAEVNVTANTGKAMAELDRVMAKVRQLGGMTATVRVRVDAGGVSEKLASVSGMVHRLDGQTAKINVNADTARARIEMAGISRASNELARKSPTIHVNTSGIPKAAAEMRALGNQIHSGRSQAAAWAFAISTLGPAALVAFGVAAKAALAAGATFATAGAGLAVYGLAARNALGGVFGAFTKLSQLRQQYAMATSKKQKDAILEKQRQLLGQLSPMQRKALFELQRFKSEMTHFGSGSQSIILNTFITGLRGIEAAMHALEPVVRPVALVIQKIVQEISQAAAGPGFKRFANWLAIEAPRAILTFWNAGKLVVSALVTILRKMGAFNTSGFLNWISMVAVKFNMWANSPGATKFGQFLKEAAPAVGRLTANLLQLAATLARTTAGMGLFTIRALATMVGWLNTAISRFPILGPILISLYGAFRLLLIASKIALAIQALKESEIACAIATRIWTAAQWAFNLAARANPYVLLATLLIALGVAIVVAYKKSATFRAICQGAFNGVKAAGVAMWNGLRIAFNGIVGAARAVGNGVRGALSTLAGVFRSAGNGIRGAWSATTHFLVNTWHSAWNNIRGFFSSSWAHIRGTFSAIRGGVGAAWRATCNFLRNTWNSAWNGVRGVMNAAWGHIRGTFNAIRGGVGAAWRAVCNFIRNTWNSAWRFARNVVSSASGAIRGAINTMRGGVGNAWRAVCNFIKNAWNSAWRFVRSVMNSAWSHLRGTFGAIRGGVSSSWRAVCNFLRNAWNSAWRFIRSVFSNAWSHIRGTFGAIRAGVSSAWRAVCNFIRNAWNNAWKFARSVFNSAWSHIRGTFNAFHNTANHIWRLICNGLKNGWRAAWNFMRSVFSSAWGHIRTTFNTLHHFASHVWTLVCNGLRNGWRAAWNAVRGAFSNAWGHIRTTFNSMHHWLSATWSSICHGLINGWRSAMNGIRSAFNFMWGKVRGSIHVMAQTMGAMWRNIVHGTGVIWNGIKAAVGKPINAVIGFVQKLAALADKALGLVGIHKNFAGALNGFKIGGFANGGVFEVNHGVSHTGTVTGFAGGGLMPGYSPGRDNLVASSPIGPVGLSGGEGILRPEVMRVPGMKEFLYTANRNARSGGISAVKHGMSANAGPKNGEDTFKAFGLRPEFQNPNGGFKNGGVVRGFANGGIIPDPISNALHKVNNVVKTVIPGISSAEAALSKGKSIFEKTAFDVMVQPLLKAFESSVGKAPGAFGTITTGIGKNVLQSIIDYVVGKTTPVSADGDPTYKNPSKRLKNALSWAQAQNGKPYQWGGGGDPSWDCSGFMAAIQNVINSGSPGGRLYTTHDFQGKRAPSGWVKDLASPFMVGVTNAGVGHMAGTLINHHVESSGSMGVGVDHGHRGAFDKLFKDHYGYKPVVHDATLVNASGGKGGPMSGTIGNGSGEAFVGTFWDTGSSGYGDTGAPASGKKMHKFALASRNLIPYGKTAIMQAFGQKRMAAFESIDYGPGITSRLFDIDTYGAAWLFGKEGQWSSSNPGRDVSPGVFRVHWKKGYAKGGTMPRNTPAIVGENGPEVLQSNAPSTRVHRTGTRVSADSIHVEFKDKVYVKNEKEFENMVVTAISEAKRKKKI